MKAEVFWKNKGYQRDEDISDRNFSRQLIGLNDFGKTLAAKDPSVMQISSAYESLLGLFPLPEGAFEQRLFSMKRIRMHA